jgi:sterol 14-demethylase
MFGQNLTFTIGPRAHDAMLQADDDEVSQRDVYQFMTPVFGRGIVYDAPLEVMREQMKWVSSALQPAEIKTYAPMVQREAEAYFAEVQDGEHDILQHFSKLVILTASRCLMGEEVRSRLSGDIAQIYAVLDAGITPISVFYPYLPIPQHWARDEAHLAMVELFRKVMEDRREEYRKHPEREHTRDVLQKLMDAKYSDGSRPTDANIAGMMIALLFAGQHTSSITSTWTTLLLAHHAAVRARVEKEVADSFSRLAEEQHLTDAAAAPALTYDDVTTFDILRSTVTEAVQRLNEAGYRTDEDE